jgi:hypothetical protein
LKPSPKIKNNLCVLSDLCGEIPLGMASDFMKFHTRSTVFEETQCLGGGTISTAIKKGR